jgi:hypothetical protein
VAKICMRGDMVATLWSWPYPWNRVRQALDQPQGNWVRPTVLCWGQLWNQAEPQIKSHIIPGLSQTQSCFGHFLSIAISGLGLFGGVACLTIQAISRCVNHSLNTTAFTMDTICGFPPNCIVYWIFNWQLSSTLTFIQ